MRLLSRLLGRDTDRPAPSLRQTAAETQEAPIAPLTRLSDLARQKMMAMSGPSGSQRFLVEFEGKQYTVLFTLGANQLTIFEYVESRASEEIQQGFFAIVADINPVTGKFSKSWAAKPKVPAKINMILECCAILGQLHGQMIEEPGGRPRRLQGETEISVQRILKDAE